MAAINSRNELETYTYFFHVGNNKRTLSKISFPEFKIYQYVNPVTSDRGIAYLTDSYTTNVYALSDDEYKKETFTHPQYRNQKNEYIVFKYSELPIIIVGVDESRIIK